MGPFRKWGLPLGAEAAGLTRRLRGNYSSGGDRLGRRHRCLGLHRHGPRLVPRHRHPRRRRAAWRTVNKEYDQPPWAYLLDSGLVQKEEALTWRARVWRGHEDL